MKIVVPLAGPDFVQGKGTKAEIDFDGLPLLRRALESRSWWRRGECSAADLIFVMRDLEPVRAFAARCLLDWYPGARIVWLSRSTKGAALSALAGVAMAPEDEILVIDLADILFEENAVLSQIFAEDQATDAIALTFPSQNPAYSYLLTNESGEVVRAAEKIVISTNASAGVYIFRNLSVYLRALAHNLDRRAEVTHRDLFFVCPVYNGVIAAGGRVALASVSAVRDIKCASDPRTDERDSE